MTEASITKRSSRIQRLILMAGALLLAGLLAIPASGIALASSQPQTPPPADELTLLNHGENLIERKKKGNLIGPPPLRPAGGRPLPRRAPPRYR